MRQDDGSLRKDGRHDRLDNRPRGARPRRRPMVQGLRLRAHTEILDSLAPLVFDLLAEGWDTAVRSMCYKDGTPVEIVVNGNPYRRPTA